MLDIYTRSPSGVPYPVLRGAEFLRIELSARADGNFLASLTATTVDEDEPQLIDQEIASERVASIDEFLALIKTHVRIAQPAAPLPRGLRREAAMAWFRNHYRCARCGHEWTDEWSATCDDDCPQCGARRSSHQSEDIPAPNGGRQ